MKRVSIIVLCLVMVLGLSLAGCTSTPTTTAATTAATTTAATTGATTAATTTAATTASEVDLTGKVFGMIPITLANGYHQAQVSHQTTYAKEKYGIELKVLDGKFDQPTITKNLDQLVAEGVDAIILHTYEAESVEAGIQSARDAGIPIITFYLQTAKSVPFVAINEASAAKQMGIAAATNWKKFWPDKPIKIGVIDYIDSPVVQAMRTGPFVEGIKSVDATAELVKKIDGGGTRETGYKAAQDLLQSNPECNIIYGASSDYSLAILPALQEAGRGKAIDGVPQTEILVGTDATEAELVNVFDPSSSFKVTMGLTPKENAYLLIDTMVKAYTGEIDPDSATTVEATDKPIDFWSADIAEVQAWLEEQYMTKVDLSAKK